jgi:hypothetical protein
MEKQERQQLFDSLYPVGEERWFKVRIIDQKKCMKNLPWVEDKERLGFEVTSITVRDEFQPQVVGLMDMKDEILSHLFQCQESAKWSNDMNMIHKYDMLMNTYREMFNAKISEINSRTIKTTQYINEQS